MSFDIRTDTPAAKFVVKNAFIPISALYLWSFCFQIQVCTCPLLLTGGSVGALAHAPLALPTAALQARGWLATGFGNNKIS